MRMFPSWLLVLFTLSIAILIGFYAYNPVKSTSAFLRADTQSLSTASSGLRSPMSAATATTTNAAKMLYPALYICHGAGPMPLLGDLDHVAMVSKWKEHVKDITGRYGAPKAIAVVSAHYQTRTPEVGGCPQPEMYYDYGGFPKEAYSLQYPAPGAPELAAQMVAKLQQDGFAAAALNPQRKYDHGIFVPLMAMFENASIPVIPVSVLRSNDPAEHIKMGHALRQFREQGVFFVGSGASMHHFDRFFIEGAGTRLGNAITAVLEDPSLSHEARLAKMTAVESFDGFRDAQPPHYDEHLMPLLTLVGTSDGALAREVASIPFYAANVRHYLFEE